MEGVYLAGGQGTISHLGGSQYLHLRPKCGNVKCHFWSLFHPQPRHHCDHHYQPGIYHTLKFPYFHNKIGKSSQKIFQFCFECSPMLNLIRYPITIVIIPTVNPLMTCAIFWEWPTDLREQCSSPNWLKHLMKIVNNGGQINQINEEPIDTNWWPFLAPRSEGGLGQMT